MVHNPSIIGNTSIYHPEIEKDINDELPFSPTQRYMPTCYLLYVKMISSIESSRYTDPRSLKTDPNCIEVPWTKHDMMHDQNKYWLRGWYDMICYAMLWYDMIWATQTVGYTIDTIIQTYECVTNSHYYAMSYNDRQRSLLASCSPMSQKP